MTKDQIIEYHLKNEEARYAAEKEKQKTRRYVIVTLLICLTIVSCFWIYFGIAVEEVGISGHGNNAIIESNLEDSNVWQ